MKKRLKKNTIYFADNGRLICHECAGMSALYTGRDISGQKVEPLSKGDMLWLAKECFDGTHCSCERGCTTVDVRTWEVTDGRVAA